jgi:hypothetical protein
VEKSTSSHARAANFTKHVQEPASCKITRIAIVGRAGCVDIITVSDMELNLLETRVLIQHALSIRRGTNGPTSYDNGADLGRSSKRYSHMTTTTIVGVGQQAPREQPTRKSISKGLTTISLYPC